MAYQAGFSAGITFFLDGGAAVTLNVTGHTWIERVIDLVTTHTGSGGVEARIAGVLQGDGTVDANIDAAALPCAVAPGIRAGAKGVITHSISSTTPFSIHVMILEVTYKSVVNGLVQYSFKAGIDSTSGAAYARAT